MPGDPESLADGLMPAGTADPEAPASPPEPPAGGPSARRNFALGVLNAVFNMTGMGFVRPDLVLSPFAYGLTGRNFYASLLASMNMLTLRLPQLVASRMVEHRRRKKPFYVVASALRIASWVVISAAVLGGWGMDRRTVFAVFFALYVAAGLCSGFGAVPFTDMIGKMIPEQRLGTFYSFRVVFGRIGALLPIIPVYYILRLEFPYNYGLLFLCYTVLGAAGALSFAAVKEPVRPVARRRKSWGATLLAGPRYLASDPAYRLLFAFRSLRFLAMMAMPLYIIYAGIDRSNRSAIALMMGARVCGDILGAAVAGPISERRGPARLLVVSSGGAALVPVIALAAARLPAVELASLGSMSLDARVAGFMAFYFAMGVVNVMGMIGANACLVGISPERERPSYVASFNTMLVPFFLLPRLAAGAISDSVGHEAAIKPCIVFGLLALIFALRLARRYRRPSP